MIGQRLRAVELGECIVVRHEQTDVNCHVVVVTDHSQSANEWMVIEDGQIVAQSTAGYGSATSALRDGLIFDECGKVMRDEDGTGDWKLDKSPWVHVDGSWRRSD